MQGAYLDPSFVKTVQNRFFHKFRLGAFKEQFIASLMTWEVGTTPHAAAACGQKEEIPLCSLLHMCVCLQIRVLMSTVVHISAENVSQLCCLTEIDLIY